MENFVDAVRKAIEDKNWYGALFIALTLPDICGKINDSDKVSGRIRYSRWFEKYMKGYNGYLSGNDCYELRCALLHEGSDKTGAKTRDVLEHFIFLNGGTHLNLVQNSNVAGKVESFLQLSVDVFCEDICIAVELWLHSISSDQKIQKRLSKIIEIHDPGYTYGALRFG